MAQKKLHRGPLETRRLPNVIDENRVQSQAVLDVLDELQKKIMGAPALNGGFDKLLLKVDKIDDNQAQMGAKVDMIHDAIYRPDDGLFARVKDVEVVKAHVEKIQDLEKNILIIEERRLSEVDDQEKNTKLNEEHDKAINQHDAALKDLMAFKARTYAIVKWVLMAGAGAIATAVTKLFYDFVSGHITIH